MDLNRFSVAIERKIAGDFSNYNHLKNKIDFENLNLKQRAITEYALCFHKTIKADPEAYCYATTFTYPPIKLTLRNRFF